MKKKYITPEATVYNITAKHQLLAGSPLSVREDPYDESTMTDL